MTDREKIISNDFYDVVTDFNMPGIFTGALADSVYQPVSGEIGVGYINRAAAPTLGISNYTYPVIPKLYGLMQMPLVETFDPTQLIRSGILQVQEGALGLTGRGVVIGFLDTGERVIILLSQ